MSENEKKPKEKSVMEIAREMELLRQEEEEKARELARQAEEERRNAYEKQLREERLELMRMKQGVIEESETIREEQEEKKKYTIGQKISNFIYHNKWWMGVSAFFAAIVGVLVYQTVTMVRPDLIVMLVSYDSNFSTQCTANISTLFEQYIDDVNATARFRWMCTTFLRPMMRQQSTPFPAIRKSCLQNSRWAKRCSSFPTAMRTNSLSPTARWRISNPFSGSMSRRRQCASI